MVPFEERLMEGRAMVKKLMNLKDNEDNDGENMGIELWEVYRWGCYVEYLSGRLRVVVRDYSRDKCVEVMVLRTVSYEILSLVGRSIQKLNCY